VALRAEQERVRLSDDVIARDEARAASDERPERRRRLGMPPIIRILSRVPSAGVYENIHDRSPAFRRLPRFNGGIVNVQDVVVSFGDVTAPATSRRSDEVQQRIVRRAPCQEEVDRLANELGATSPATPPERTKQSILPRIEVKLHTYH
jgi:hypothetical protein